MSEVKFLAGKNLEDKDIEFQPGTFYLDLAKQELWFDSPLETQGKHVKIINENTIKHDVLKIIDNVSVLTGIAIIGQGVIGKMVMR